VEEQLMSPGVLSEFNHWILLYNNLHKKPQPLLTKLRKSCEANPNAQELGMFVWKSN